MADGGGNKRLSVERIYQKKSQLEHILLRPDTYIGSVQVVAVTVVQLYFNFEKCLVVKVAMDLFLF